MPAQWKRVPPQRPRRRVCLSPSFFAVSPFAVRGVCPGKGATCPARLAHGRPWAALALRSLAASVWPCRLLRSVFARGGRQARRSGSPFPRQWVRWKARGFGERPEALPNEPVFRRVRLFLTGPQGGQEVRVKGATPPCGGRGGKAPLPEPCCGVGRGEARRKSSAGAPGGRPPPSDVGAGSACAAAG